MEKIKILLIDDHQIVIDGLKKIILDVSDFELVGSLNNACDAIQFIEKNNIDVIIADMSMPKISGIELTKKVMANFKHIKIIILSMYNNEDYVFSALQAGAKGYLTKQDSTTEVLIEAIRTVNGGDEYFSPNISKSIMKSIALNASKQTNLTDYSQRQTLTVREKEILKLYVDGFSNNEIADNV